MARTMPAGCLDGGSERHEGVYVPVAGQALHVIASDQATETMAYDVDAFVAGYGRKPRDGLAQPYGCPRDAVRKQSVVVADSVWKPRRRSAFHHGEDRVIVDDPVPSRIGVWPRPHPDGRVHVAQV